MGIKDETEELKKLLNITAIDSNTVSQQITEELPEELEPEPLFEFDYDGEMKKAYNRASAAVMQIVKAVLPEEYHKHSYIKDKIKEDSKQLGKLYYQQLSIETMQKANMEAVSKGNAAARMFEVFTQLSKAHSDIAKQISDHQVTLRKSYIDMKLDIQTRIEEEMYAQNGQPALPGPENNQKQIDNIHVGTRSLIEELMQEKIRSVREVLPEE